MYDPESMSPGSIMPPYPWLLDQDINTDYTAAKIRVLKMLNTPYPHNYENEAVDKLKAQAKIIAKSIVEELAEEEIDLEVLETKEIVALIAYLQRLGTDIKPKTLDK